MVIFTSQRTGGADDAYDEAAERMGALAAASEGYLGHRSARGADGLGVTVSYWRTAEDADAFRQVPEHRAVQVEGRTHWYEWYVSEVAEVRSVRTHEQGVSPARAGTRRAG